MKKKLTALCMLALFFISCNSALHEAAGTVVLDLDGSSSYARALDSNGLPAFDSSALKIEVSGDLSGYFVKEFAVDEPKNLTLSLPVGDRVNLTVSVYSKSGIWSGTSLFTVQEGLNAVSVAFDKKVSGLKNLLFTQEMDEGRYELTFYLGEKEIDLPDSSVPYLFARDSLGQIYVKCKKSNAVTLLRYTSEGDKWDGTFQFPLAMDEPSMFMNDFTTGTMYLVDKSGSVYKVEKDKIVTTTISSLSSSYDVPAIDNNRLVWVWTDPDGASKIRALNIDQSDVQGVDFKGGEIEGCASSHITDLFIRNGYVYVLFQSVTSPSISGSSFPVCALGGVVRYNIHNLNEAPVKIGFIANPNINRDERILINYDYSQNFYGAVKVIGFDDQFIYIADEGFDVVFGKRMPTIGKDRNRIAQLNIRTNEVRFTDVEEAEWYNEWDD